jgi:hypothetical protein
MPFEQLRIQALLAQRRLGVPRRVLSFLQV